MYTSALQDKLLEFRKDEIDVSGLLPKIVALLDHADATPDKLNAPTRRGDWSEWKRWIEKGITLALQVKIAAVSSAKQRILRETRVYLCTIDRRARKIMTVLLFIWVRT